jgi:heptosyltransferase I
MMNGKHDADTPREIGIVMLSALGDSVHVLPVANALKRAWPAARITWIVHPPSRRLHEGHPAIDEFVVFTRRRGWGAVRAYVELRRQLAGRPFDLVLALQVYFKAGLVTALTRAPVKLGFDRARAADLNWLFTSERVPPHPVQHAQDSYLELVRHLGIDPHPIEWRITLTPDEEARAEELRQRAGRPICGVVVATSKREKNWFPDRYARVLEALEDEHGFAPVLIGGPSPIEREMVRGIMAETRARPIDALGDDVRRLVWLTAASDLVISPDTGPLHLARAMDIPVIGLYGYTNPLRGGPYRKYLDLLVDGYAIREGERYPCSMTYRPGGMDRVTVDAVLASVALARRRYLQREPARASLPDPAPLP